MDEAGGRAGSGILTGVVAVAVVVLCGGFATAVLRHAATAESDAWTTGRRALDAARSALDEAAAEVRAQINRPGSSWFRSVRETPTSASGMEWWLVEEIQPRLTAAAVAAPGIAIQPVRTSIWRDFAFDPAHGPYDEKQALLTLTATVEHPDPSGPFRGVVRRRLQQSFALKQQRMSAPAPFSRWTMYVDRLPLLATQKDSYDRTLRDFAARRRKLEEHYREEIDGVVSRLETYLDWMRRKVADLADTRKLIERTREKVRKAEAAVPLTLGLAAPAAEKGRAALEGLEAGLSRDLRQTLARFGLPDEETFTRVALDPYPASALRSDIAFALTPGAWPSFRGYVATGEGLSGAGEPLDNPVIAERMHVATRELDYALPAAPPLPRRPTYSLAPADIDWTDRYRRIREEFRRYVSEYDERMKAFITAYAAEFARHEELFHVLSERPQQLAQQLVDLSYQTRRASHFFASENAFRDAVVGPDGVARLEGVYAIAGDLSRFPERYRGRGVLVVQGDAKLAAVRRDGAHGSLLVIAGRDVTVSGPCEAGVLAPAGRVRTEGAGATVGLAVVGRVAAADGYTVDRRSELVEEGADGLWVTVSPAPLAEALLRR